MTLERLEVLLLEREGTPKKKIIRVGGCLTRERELVRREIGNSKYTMVSFVCFQF